MSISTQELAITVAELTAPDKGILAADESLGTIEKRLKAVDIASTEHSEHRGSPARLPRVVIFHVRPQRFYQRRHSVRGNAQAEKCSRRAVAGAT